jgi:transposase
MDTEHSAITEPVRRLEVFTGAGRRRTWRDQDKARIVAEIAATICRSIGKSRSTPVREST